MITAPFNFVPLNKKVFFPPWAENVSHDVPFEDGESGTLDITITAKSPIFIRDHQHPKEFCQHNGQYYIPGSSLKGMVRNVLEIMSFSKLDKNSFDDNTYAVRDLSSAKNFYMTQMNLISEPTTQCGWLVKNGDKYIIEDCGTPGRIHHNQIDYALTTDFSSKFHRDGFEKTSEYKYNLLDGKIHSIQVGEKYKSEANAKYDKREFYKFDKKGQNSAHLIVTGQPTSRKNTGKMGDGKGFEFLFFEKKGDLNVAKDIFENFLFAYFNERKTEPKESPDWKYWKKKLYAGEKIPVFFQKNGKQVLHFGLSYLYKLPYKYSIQDGIDPIHFENRADLAQTIFGYINKDTKEALKGRVQFSHCKAISNIKLLQPRTEILGTPRASYYPIYVRQYNTEFKTYMDSDFSIAGRKRYPIHKGNKTTKTGNTENENVGTPFTPLADGVIFKGKLRYHNLKKSELGALLSTLTFHNSSNCYHNIGMAKSLGYGKISLKVDGISNKEEYLKAFETEMTATVEEWAQCQQLTELITMATEQENTKNSQLVYMKLENFANNKSKSKDYLRNYTLLDNIKTATVSTLISQEDIEQAKKAKLAQDKAEVLRLEQLKEAKEFEAKLQTVLKSDNIQVLENFITAHPDYAGVDELVQRKKSLQKAQESNKHQKLNDEAQKAWEGIHDPKYIKGLQKSLQSFIKKWTRKHKDSEFILELIEKAKQEIK